MKKIFSIIIIIIIMFILSILSLLPKSFRLDLLSGGSMGYLMDVNSVNILLQFFLLLLSVTFLFLMIRTFNKYVFVLFIIFFICWLMSGRVIGILEFPDAKVTTGWFYLPTNEFKVCQIETDCETTMHYKTTIKRMSFWRVRIKNEYVDKRIFLGPIVWSKGLKMIDNKFPAGTPSAED